MRARTCATTLLLLAFSIFACLPLEARAQTQPVGGAPAAMGKAYRLDKIADGVYYATANGTMITGGNNPVIVNDHDVMLVDDGTTPAAARALLQDLKLIIAEEAGG